MLLFISYLIFTKPEIYMAFNFNRIFMRDTKGKTIEGYLHDKIYLRSRVKVPCFGNPPKGAKTFFWEHSGENIPHHYGDEKYAVDDDDGSLTINDVSLDDAGVFYCKVDGTKIIKHVIEVVQIPNATLQIYIIYQIQSCIKENEEVAKLFIEYKLHENICLWEECKIDSVESECHFGNIPSLHVKIFISIKTTPDDSCDAICTRQKSLNLQLQIPNFIKNIVEQSKLNLLDGEQVSPSYYSHKIQNSCDLGFEMKSSGVSSLCVPCMPGHFFDNGHCILCPYNKYTENYGSENCQTCDAFYVTSIRGASSKEACRITKSGFLLQIFLVSLPILFIIVLCCWYITQCCKRKIGYSTTKNSHKKTPKSYHKYIEIDATSESEIEQKSVSVPIQNRGHPRSSKEALKAPYKKDLKYYRKHNIVQSTSESETKRKADTTKTRGQNPRSSKNDQKTTKPKERNHRQLEMTEVNSKNMPKKSIIPRPPPLPTKPKLIRNTRNV